MFGRMYSAKIVELEGVIVATRINWHRTKVSLEFGMEREDVQFA